MAKLLFDDMEIPLEKVKVYDIPTDCVIGVTLPKGTTDNDRDIIGENLSLLFPNKVMLLAEGIKIAVYRGGAT